MNPVLLALALPQTVEIDWFLSAGLRGIVAFHFVTGAVSGYPVNSLAPVKLQRTHDSSFLPFLAPAAVGQ